MYKSDFLALLFQVKVLVETRNRDHTKEMFSEMLNHYSQRIRIEGEEAEALMAMDRRKRSRNRFFKDHVSLSHMDSSIDLQTGMIHGDYASQYSV